MNKKLFLAGVALLAAVGFTSCNSDTPIDSSNPSGVTPTTAYHKVGGDYDWTAIAKDNVELMKFWNEDATEVGNVLAKKSIANILLDVSGFELDPTPINLPDFWKNNGTGAKGKIVNIIITGNFKKADFERVEYMKVSPAKYPVTINTDQLAGAEVNFTFDAEKFDLNLLTTLTRSTLNGTFLIGHMYFEGAQNLSAVQINGGTVEAINLGSTGDVEENGGDVLGAWYDVVGGFGLKADGATPKAENDIWVTEKGIGLGDNKKVVVKNLAVEDDITLSGNIKNGAGKITKLDVIAFASELATTVTLPKESYVGNIIGKKEANNKVKIAFATDLKNIDEIEKVTIDGAAVDLEISKDIFTDVTFATKSVKFAVDKFNTIDKVTFPAGTDLKVSVKADDQTMTFNGVKFYQTPELYSENEVTLDTDTYNNPILYQWVIDDTDPTKGEWQVYTNANQIKAYNVGQTEYEFTENVNDGANSVVDFVVNAAGKKIALKKGAKATAEDEANMKAAKNLIKVKQLVPANVKYNLIPANFNIVMDGDCQFWNGAALAKTDAALNNIWGYKDQIVSSGTYTTYMDKVAWYGVKYNDSNYKWVPYLIAGSTMGKYILVKDE